MPPTPTGKFPFNPTRILWGQPGLSSRGMEDRGDMIPRHYCATVTYHWSKKTLYYLQNLSNVNSTNLNPSLRIKIKHSNIDLFGLNFLLPPNCELHSTITISITAKDTNGNGLGKTREREWTAYLRVKLTTLSVYIGDWRYHPMPTIKAKPHARSLQPAL